MSEPQIPIYVGMMSGTSMDGVDAVAAVFTNGRYQFIGRSSESYSTHLRSSLISLCSSGPDEVLRCQECGNEVAKIYAKVFNKLLEEPVWKPQTFALSARTVRRFVTARRWARARS